MAQIFGSIERSIVEGSTKRTVFRIPAFSKSGARQRAKVNARLKNLDNYNIDNIEKVGSGDVPKSSFYDVTIISER